MKDKYYIDVSKGLHIQKVQKDKAGDIRYDNAAIADLMN